MRAIAVVFSCRTVIYFVNFSELLGLLYQYLIVATASLSRSEVVDGGNKV
jgi:hypothetical protein